MRIVVPLFVAAGLLCGCSSEPDEPTMSDQVLCPAWYAPGMMIEVRDALTGLPAACGAEAKAESDTHSDTLTTGVDCGTFPEALIMTGIQYPGIYSLTIAKEGYEPWIRPRIEVTSGVCGLIPVHLRADLTPI